MGVKGEVRLKLFGAGVDGLSAHRRLWVGGVERRLLSAPFWAGVRLPASKGSPIAAPLRAFAVRSLNDRLALPPLEDGEYYHVDLIGLPCVDQAGDPVGTVVAVENYGAGDYADIEGEDGKRSLIPFRHGIADRLDGRIVIDPEFLA